MDIIVEPYSEEWKSRWDDFVRQSRQGTFLFQRNFMDYHSDRFADVSLVFVDAQQKIQALLPACCNPQQPVEVVSHAGLTYGGLLTGASTTTVVAGRLLEKACAFYKERGFTSLIYKPVPSIYHLYPSEEDLYWIFRMGGHLKSRAVSSVIDMQQPYPLSQLRRRKVRKASQSNQLRLETDMNRLEDFWIMLNDVLVKRHQTHPVHSLAELQLLCSRFPNQIRLVTALVENDSLPRIVAGCLLFITERVVHVQYIAASEEGCQKGALDWLFAQLIEKLPVKAPQCAYLDFGISTEQGGQVLNEGLIFQKEGFGARAACYDSYSLKLQ